MTLSYGYTRNLDELYLVNFATLRLRDVLSRIRGVGEVIIFPASDYAMRVWVRPDRLAQLGLTPAGLTHMPSIDVAMGSAADAFGNRAIGVLLTGMGDDGARGLLRMREQGAYTIAESEASAVIWGMPRVAAELGAASHVAALQDIPGLIARRARANR